VRLSPSVSAAARSQYFYAGVDVDAERQALLATGPVIMCVSSTTLTLSRCGERFRPLGVGGRGAVSGAAGVPGRRRALRAALIY
jgi:hypothetical protein